MRKFAIVSSMALVYGFLATLAIIDHAPAKAIGPDGHKAYTFVDGPTH